MAVITRRDGYVCGSCGDGERYVPRDSVDGRDAQFVERRGSFDLADYEELQRQEAPESVCLAHDVEILYVKPLLQQDDGDVIVEVMVWSEGWTAGEVTRKQARSVKTHKIDQTPVHVYAVRKGLGWRIAAEYRSTKSTDADMDQYGPDTPHDVRPPTSEWRVD